MKFIIMRGVSGSGKSTRAKELGNGGVILSTDDFFMKEGKYEFDASKLWIAHSWNRKRAAKALKEGVSPIVIDNTNTQAKEMKDYVIMAKEANYEINIEEPKTEWWSKFKKDMPETGKQELIDILTSRNAHNVPREIIAKMLDRWEFDVTPESILL